ncbi:hypothetical protein D9M71_612290 [compost metagenome]
MGQAVVQAQFLNPLRRASLIQVGGCRAHDRAAHTQAPGDEAGVHVIAGANGQVDALVHQVDGAVEHLQFYLHVRKAPHIGGHCIHQLCLAE